MLFCHCIFTDLPQTLSYYLTNLVLLSPNLPLILGRVNYAYPQNSSHWLSWQTP